MPKRRVSDTERAVLKTVNEKTIVSNTSARDEEAVFPNQIAKLISQKRV